MANPSITNKKRLVLALFFVCFVFTFLILRLGWIQIVNSEKYRIYAVRQQTRDVPIPAKRGTIYDRNGKELATSITTYTVWATPSEIKSDEVTAKSLSDILGIEKDEIYKKISNKKSGLVKIAKWIDKEKADKIRKEKLRGIRIAEDNKRYYPYGNFASYILGHTTDDNRGLVGVELQYDKVLSGLPGRWIKNTDAAGRQLPYGIEKYYKPENGLNLVLTIDEVIQHFAEKAVENALATTKSKRVMAIVMEPKTGDILAMAVKPDYDPNNPRVPLDKAEKERYKTLSINEKQKLWNKMWRNPIVSDTYEPGSTFKLITSAAGLEEGVVEPNSPFYSPGYAIVAGHKIKCWRYYRPHGHETFTEAVQNSCNPVFIEVAQRLGLDKFYKYLNAFGFTEKTGIDLPGESNAIVRNKKNIGPVELATMSFGHGISVTPIQLITAISAVANDGKLMQPRIVKELTDDAGNVIHRYEPRFVRQVLSEKTARELRMIMEKVVTDGSGKKAYVPGFRVGGKTGTAEKIINGRYSKGSVYSSFVAIAPVNDPKITVLVICDEPQGIHFGSLTAAPVAGEIIRDTLRYLEVEPQYNEEEKAKFERKDVVVPEVRSLTLSEASKILSKNNLDFGTEPISAKEPNMIVVDQFPNPGAKVPEKSMVILYLKKRE
ncbi:stage V sporulation protein D (sporulation-specific penicillin-binding protein) [Caminicella sporogenes DSM 14501]|uniref:Stage V sporulation protein D (Sporulation-specific penicillin-binding protein) n=1 Tax=Caminicella sporogenes DSM 14501 TaxID=1121266 RepID=A0A1M6L0N0_9FIRM|nr:stage V sporulation protein D [Caminicella sporogenes]RKD27666.1 stage V sporulation protein D [Caminicella sporogenes]SHJ64825.1 stage V sporulation protein D (sporulation-specific penicillin-binding protein) [Caminicella sporogenes DSM 14501]